jgi:hypothetical protein
MTEPGTPTGRPSRAAHGLLVALVGLALLLAGILVGAVPAAAGNRVGASTPVMINTVGVSADIAAGQRLGKTVPQPGIVVATGVAANTAVDDIGLARYADGGGHHIPAKSAFRGADAYDPAQALAVPNAELSRLGINHAVITGAQARLYSAFARTGSDLTWDAMQSIETQAMIAGGASPSAAQSVVARAIAALQDAGVSGPTRIPWGG